MIALLERAANHGTTWVILPITLVLLPVMLFGTPGYYGDDLHFFLSLDKYGTGGAIAQWTTEYGWIYRPLGAAVEYGMYALLREQEALFYLFSLLVYVLFVVVLHRVVLRLTSDPLMATFVTLFFALFPFNSTAYLQLSSVYMVLAGVLGMVMLNQVGRDGTSFQVGKLLPWLLFWFVLLLIYEQVTGLVAALGLLVMLRHWQGGAQKAFFRAIIVSVVFGAVTLLFVALYVFAPNNPKIVSLNKLNETYAVEQQKALEDTNIEGFGPEQVAITQSESIDGASIKADLESRLQALQARLVRVGSYFVDNIRYAVLGLLDNGLLGWLNLLAILAVALLALFVRVSPLGIGMAGVYIAFGCIWFIATIAPFMLYRAAHIPVYTLLLPSVGLGIAGYGGYWLIFQWAGVRFASKGFKALILTVLVVFPLLQLGYYFGLREELDYWRSLSTQIEPVKEQLTTGKEVRVMGVPVKENGHIFWLENAVGHRYLRALLGEEFAALSISREPDQHTVRFLPESVSGEPIVVSFTAGSLNFSAESP